MIHSTAHDRFAYNDYRAMMDFGIRTVRDGIRWHLIDSGGTLNFDSVMPMIEAAERTGIEVIWDIFHFGWPDDIDVFSAGFIRRYAKLARGFAQALIANTSGKHWIAPSNEISFVAWAGGDVAYINPLTTNRGWELKKQLAAGAIAAIEEIKGVSGAIRMAFPEPVIHLVGRPEIAGDEAEAEAYRLLQYQAWDMIAGRLEPALGGREEYLDTLGLNFYDRNEWVNHGRTLRVGQPRYRPFSEIVREVYERYRRPLFVAETGVEDRTRPSWFAYICSQCERALDSGVPLKGICWYPIADHPGWDDDRYCPNGLLGFADEKGNRNFDQPLAAEWRRQAKRFAHRR